MYNDRIIKGQRVVAAVLFLYRLVGWSLYPYPIDRTYTTYSFFMMLACLVGALGNKNWYKSRFGLIPVGLYVSSAILTLCYAVREAMEGSKAALQSMSIRIFEIALLLSLTVAVFSFRRLGKTGGVDSWLFRITYKK